MEKSRGIRRFISMKPNKFQKLEITNQDSHGRLVKGILFPSRFVIMECLSRLELCENSDFYDFVFAIHLDPKESLVITLFSNDKMKESGKVGCESEGILRVLVSKDPHTRDQQETPPLHCLPDTFIATDLQFSKRNNKTKMFTGDLDPLDGLISIEPIPSKKYGEDPPENVKISPLNNEQYALNAIRDERFEKCECRGNEPPEMPNVANKNEKSDTNQKHTTDQIVEEPINQEAEKQEKKNMCVVS